MNYTEEQYSELYNSLPKGLRDLILTGRLSILANSLGMKYSLSKGESESLETSVEDVCLGLITPSELAANISSQVGVEAAKAEEISKDVLINTLGEYTDEIKLTRKYKIELDEKIRSEKKEDSFTATNTSTAQNIIKITKEEPRENTQSNLNTPRSVPILKAYSSQPAESFIPTSKKASWDDMFTDKKPEDKSLVKVEQQIVNLTQSVNKLASINEVPKLVPQNNNSNINLYDELNKRIDLLNHKVDDLSSKLVESQNKIKVLESGVSTNIIAVPNNPVIAFSDLVSTEEVAQKPILENKKVFNDPFASAVSKNTLDTILESKKIQINTNPIIIKKEALDFVKENKIKSLNEVENKKSEEVNRKKALSDILLGDLKALELGNKETEKATIVKNISEEIKPLEENSLLEELTVNNDSDRVKSLQEKIKNLNKGISYGSAISSVASATDPYQETK